MEGFEYARLFDSLFILDFASLSLLPPSPFLLSSLMSELWSLVLDSSHLASSLSSVCQYSCQVRSDCVLEVLRQLSAELLFPVFVTQFPSANQCPILVNTNWT